MSIDPISQASTQTTTQTPGLKGSKDEFLRLFMAQLQHQDPFAPTSGADMVAQLAQLSSVEQAKVTNDQLAELAAQQASAASAGLATLVGRDCTAIADKFELDGKGGAPPPLEISSTSPIKQGAVVITNADGKELRRIPIPEGTSTASIAWDGKDASGQPVPAGSYTIAVDAPSSSTITSRWQGRVDAVELTSTGPRLRMGGLLVAPSEIRTIGTPTTNPF
jgi:flagellar basal-body rod modification protein FlgD